ncbi:MAG TPA: methyltransferase [Chloroflexota bacterium]|nr:methyltransferase [Chloroflexota bacterium]
MAGQAEADGAAQRRTLAALIGGYRATQMIGVAARLGVADHLAAGPQGAGHLATTLGVQVDALLRLLRGLVNLGLLVESAGAETAALFSLTPLGEGLRGDVPGSQRAWAIWEGDLSYRAWGALDHSVASGETAFEHVFGRPFFDYLGEHPQTGEQFNRAMTDFSLAIGAAVAGEYDFAPYRTVVDLGGGRGHLLAAILSRHPALHGTLFDLPHLVPTAQAYLDGVGLRDRVSVVGGDFFVSVPPADLYVLSHIVHDWDDARSVRLLRVCREAVQPQGRLLIVEKYIPEPMVRGAVPPGTDVNMLVLTGGRERTEGEYRALLGAAGWRLERVLPTSSISSIFEALPR